MLHAYVPIYRTELRLSADRDPQLPSLLSPSTGSGRLAWSASADAFALLLFAAIGRVNHASDGGSLFGTAAPFLLAWYPAALLLHTYKEPDNPDFKAALLPLLPAWAVAVPLGCAGRGLAQGYMPPLPFWIVSLVVIGVLMTAGRFAVFQLVQSERAIDRFVAAIVGDAEDGEDDDF